MHSNLSTTWKSLYFMAIPFVWLIIYTNTSCFTDYYALNNKAMSKYPNTKFFICITFYFCASMTAICHFLSMYTDPGSLDKNLVQKLKEKDKSFCKKCHNR